jgi:hypothetical protein
MHGRTFHEHQRPPFKTFPTPSPSTRACQPNPPTPPCLPNAPICLIRAGQSSRTASAMWKTRRNGRRQPSSQRASRSPLHLTKRIIALSRMLTLCPSRIKLGKSRRPAGAPSVSNTPTRAHTRIQLQPQPHIAQRGAEHVDEQVHGCGPARDASQTRAAEG